MSEEAAVEPASKASGDEKAGDKAGKKTAKKKDAPAPPPKGAWGKLKAWAKRVRERWDEHVREYGAIAILVYLAIWLSVWAGFAVAISMGFDVGGDVSGGGMAAIIGAAYIPTKVSQPIRIAATLVVTPIVANLWHRIRGRDPKVRIGREAMMRKSKAPSKAEDDADDADDADDSDDSDDDAADENAKKSSD